MLRPTILPEAEANLNKSVAQILGIVTRHRWWIILPAVATIFAALGVLSVIPSRYTSDATLLVVQQQVPERYVLPTSTTNIREALQATTEEVLSRNRLLGIVEEFGLYAKERSRVSQESLLEMMRHDIEIEPIETVSEARKDISSFKISFIASNPVLAQQVTSKLTSLFIEQNLETREHQATTTTDFLREQLETAKSKLADSEEQVRAFKMQHLGELPEQQAGNLAIMAGMQAQLQSTMASLSRAQEQREYLEALSEDRALTVANDLARLKSERIKLLDRYTPEYPALIKLNEKIARTEASLKMLQVSRTAGAQASPADALPALGVAPDEDISLRQLHGQLVANRLEIENLSKDEKRLKGEIEQYQIRLNQTPVREQQLAGILRNYDQLKQDYADLLAKESQSQMAAELEKRQEGQQFRLIDRPSLPTVPSSPNRIKISLGGAGAGIGLGLALALLMNMKDSSFHSEEDLSQRFALPLVVGVPLLLTAQEERSRTRKRAFEWVAGSGLVVAVLLAQLYEFYLYRHG
jgi:polysaccharide chain length determinant protein (PEP-CTERM system associated)